MSRIRSLCLLQGLAKDRVVKQNAIYAKYILVSTFFDKFLKSKGNEFTSCPNS
jgi:hypothetical protein